MGPDSIFTVSQFVAILNQILDTALPFVHIEGEVSNYQVRSGKWVSFRLKDDQAILDCFGTVWQLQTPIEDGMRVVVAGRPQLNGKWGKFSVSLQSIKPVGEGGILRSLQLLQQRLEAEGLFEADRKRILPEYPQRIGVVSSEAADGYKDFVRIAGERWPLAEIVLSPTLVQGDSAPDGITRALSRLNELPEPPDVIAVIRGGGSSEDLLAFSAEQVVRAVAVSRCPTVVGVGHQADICLAELAADYAAATPTHAAQTITPDRADLLIELQSTPQHLRRRLDSYLEHLLGQIQSFKRQSSVVTRQMATTITNHRRQLTHRALNVVANYQTQYRGTAEVLRHLDPRMILQQGYAMIKQGGGYIQSVQQLKTGDTINIELKDGHKGAIIQ